MDLKLLAAWLWASIHPTPSLEPAFRVKQAVSLGLDLCIVPQMQQLAPRYLSNGPGHCDPSEMGNRGRRNPQSHGEGDA